MLQSLDMAATIETGSHDDLTIEVVAGYYDTIKKWREEFMRTLQWKKPFLSSEQEDRDRKAYLLSRAAIDQEELVPLIAEEFEAPYAAVPKNIQPIVVGTPIDGTETNPLREMQHIPELEPASRSWIEFITRRHQTMKRILVEDPEFPQREKRVLDVYSEPVPIANGGFSAGGRDVEKDTIGLNLLRYLREHNLSVIGYVRVRQHPRRNPLATPAR